MLQGFYKVHFQLDEAVGRSVMYAHAGRMLGGNSSFAHIGTYRESGDEIVTEIKTLRHHNDPNYRPLAGADQATLLLRGRADSDDFHFEGTLVEFAGSVFRAVMTPIDEELAPAGRARSSIRSTPRRRASIRSLAAMRSASAFPAAATIKAPGWKRSRSRASAVFD